MCLQNRFNPITQALPFRGYVDGVSQYIVSGGRYDGLLIWI